MKKKLLVVGNVLPSNYSGKVLLIEKLPDRMFRLRFINTGHERVCTHASIYDGGMEDPTSRSIGGIGIGILPADSSAFECHIYNVWYRMVQTAIRFDEGGCYLRRGIVYEPWAEYETFRIWYRHQCIRHNYFGDEPLDRPVFTRRLTSLGNIYYSPETSDIIPKWLDNALIGLREAKGWTYHKKKGQYRVSIRMNRDQKYIGVYDTVLGARRAYVREKALGLRRLAKDPILGSRIRHRLVALSYAFEKRMEIPE